MRKVGRQRVCVWNRSYVSLLALLVCRQARQRRRRERETTAIEMPTILGSSAVAFIVGFIVGWRAICGSSSPALLLWFASMSVKQTAARF